jgi:hypothetical protein
LKVWRESEPEAPERPWYKDFGSFKLCGEGKFPKTFLLAAQPARGKRLKLTKLCHRSKSAIANRSVA